MQRGLYDVVIASVLKGCILSNYANLCMFIMYVSICYIFL